MGHVAIVGHLKPVPENAETIAGRLARCFEGLAEINPLFSRWVRHGMRYRSAVPAIVTMPPDEAELRSWIGENAIVESRDGRKQQVGYAIRALTPQENTVRADFWVSSKPSAGWWFLNRMGITLLGGGGRSPVGEQDSVQRLIALLRAVLLTSATTWDCDWAAVAPGDFRWEGEHPVNVPLARFESGWMVYLDPSLAVRLGQFNDIAVEKMAGGAVLLTAVSDAVFRPRNPTHLAAALRIQAALAPLNEAQDAQTSG
jgi:hypothetical protein